MIIVLSLLCALLTSSASAASASTAAPGAPIAAPSVAILKDRFTEAVNTEEKNPVLALIAKTPPTSGQDIAGLFDLFSRFPENAVRQAVMESLAQIPIDSPQLEPLFLTYLKQPEPESQLFGINGAFRLRIRTALPLIRAIAERKFSVANASEATMMSERNAWWTQYEALSVLAQWEGEKALPLLKAKSLESPLIARILARYFWKQTFPNLLAWSREPGSLSHERALQAVGAQIDPADARATREGMLTLLRDTKADAELRHQLALKIGLSSTDDEVEALINEHDAEKQPQQRLYWASAVFVSRSPKAVALLLRYARQTLDDGMHKGATAQLADMFGQAEAARMIEDDKKK